eukprot:2137614-Pyramimonas_sp.AAC.1
MILGDFEKVTRPLVRHTAGHRSVGLIHCDPEDFKIAEEIYERMPEDVRQDMRGGWAVGSDSRQALSQSLSFG